MINYLKHLLSRSDRQAAIQERLKSLESRIPIPVFWLLGKTQSGKTSIIRFLTGAEDAELGAGFNPTTRFSRIYQFPAEQATLLSFLDTRGLGEPQYDPGEDIRRFDELAHIVIVTLRIMDHAVEPV